MSFFVTVISIVYERYVLSDNVEPLTIQTKNLFLVLLLVWELIGKAVFVKRNINILETC